MRRIAEDRHVGGARDRRPLLHARFPAAAGCFFGGCAGPRGGGVELHPDGEFFFVEDFAGDLQKANERVAQQWLPQLPDQVQLFAKRFGGRVGGSPQQFHQVHGLGAGQRNQWSGGKVFRQLLRYLAVNGLLGKRLFAEQLFEGLKRLVAVGGPQQQQLFEGRFAMRSPGCGTLQPLLRRLFAAYDGRAGEVFHKGQKQFVQRFRGYLGAKPGQSIGHDIAVELLAVAGNDDVTGLVDQSHGEEGAGVDGLVGILIRLANLVHEIREGAAGGHVDEHHVAVIGKERSGKLIALTCLARNMEFHHKNPCSRPVRRS